MSVSELEKYRKEKHDKVKNKYIGIFQDIFSHGAEALNYDYLSNESKLRLVRRYTDSLDHMLEQMLYEMVQTEHSAPTK